LDHRWVLLVYTLPHEPTAHRVSVWRKLKRLGALLIHDAVWVLPATVITREQFEWIAADIRERQGEALVWEAQLTLAGQDGALIEQFLTLAETSYRTVLDALAAPEADIATLAKRYQQIRAIDYFHHPIGDQVRMQLTQQSERNSE